MGPCSRRVAAALSGLLLMIVAPVVAGAAPPPSPNQAYWSDDSHLVYSGGIGKTNQVVVSNYSSTAFVIDDVSQIVAGFGCQNFPGDNTKVMCAYQGDSISWFTINLGMGDDTLSFGANFNTYVYIHGGSGNDTITISSLAGSYLDVKGEQGDDTVQRSSGTSYLRLYGGEGADSLCGNDAYVFYDDHTAPVIVSIGGTAGGDGSSGEGDTVCATVRGITGTDFADTLVSGNARSTLSGGGGNDLLVGGSAEDQLFGDAGTDTLHGLAGNDRLWGGAGTDTLWAGSGSDQCSDPADNLNDCETVL